MTAWTALILLVGIGAKCALDMIGLEYQAKNQILTDPMFSLVFVLCLTFSAIVDFLNLCRKK